VQVHKGIRTTGADFVTNDQHKDNIDLVVETLVDKINFEDRSGNLEAQSVVLVDKNGEKRTVKAKKEIIVSGGEFARSKRALTVSNPRRRILFSCNPAPFRDWSQGGAGTAGHQMSRGRARCGKEFARSLGEIRCSTFERFSATDRPRSCLPFTR
jgi:hypothetical protein